MNKVENKFADIISRLEAPKKGKISKCRLCKYGDSPCVLYVMEGIAIELEKERHS